MCPRLTCPRLTVPVLGLLLLSALSPGDMAIVLQGTRSSPIGNQRIAIRANREDDCTGRFWEGRFHSSKPLKTQRAVYACMTYVDLNPVSAGASPDVASPGEHTSLRRRVEEAERDKSRVEAVLAPMRIRGRFGEIYTGGTTPFEVTLRGYLEHVRWTASAAKIEAKSRPRPPPTLVEPDEWLALIQSFVRRWGRKPGRGEASLVSYASAKPEVDRSPFPLNPRRIEIANLG